MKKLLVLAVLLAACGGTQGDGGDGPDTDEPRCYSTPGFSDGQWCKPLDYAADAMCWRLDGACAEELGGWDDPDHQAGRCVLVTPASESRPEPEGTVLDTCLLPSECTESFADNPPCCDAAYDGHAYWACN